MPHHDVDFDRLGPVNDNRPTLIHRATQGSAGGRDGRVAPAGHSLHAPEASYPQATGMLGSLQIIADAGRGSAKTHGIPGILHTTSLGPLQRNRLADGIIDLSQHGSRDVGPVHKISGHDATAMNAGMRPLPGAPIHGSHSKVMDGVIEHEHSGVKKGGIHKKSRKH